MNRKRSWLVTCYKQDVLEINIYQRLDCVPINPNKSEFGSSIFPTCLNDLAMSLSIED